MIQTPTKPVSEARRVPSEHLDRIRCRHMRFKQLADKVVRKSSSKGREEGETLILPIRVRKYPNPFLCLSFNSGANVQNSIAHRVPE